MKMVKQSYAQNWSAYNKAQMNEKQLFMELLCDLCNDAEEPEYVFGRLKIPVADILFCSAFKIYSGYSGRRFTTDMRTAKEDNYISKVPHYNSLFNFLKNLNTSAILMKMIQKSGLSLKDVETKFAIDASGFSTTRYRRWFDFKYGHERDFRIWVKAHVVCGVGTNIVTAVRLSEARAHDNKFFKELINDTSSNFNVCEMSADKAYMSRNNLELVDSLGGKAYIPFRSNVTGKQRGSKLWGKMYHYFKYNNEDFMKHYHLRSNVESTFSMIKRKFGDTVRSKDKTAQFNEILCKILCHNICVVIHEMHEMGFYKKTEWAS
ncbi:MAG: transposase [Nanoarchaeota archaeon]|nr:transposase [Nanoarchaeota archaeon]MBU4123878.1 transposase [Nanoarchaeota archaeon]